MWKKCCGPTPEILTLAALIVVLTSLSGACGPGEPTDERGEPTVERDAPTVERATLWFDEVKRGDLTIQRRGTGSLEADDSGQIVAVARIPEAQSFDLAVDQQASVDTRNGVVEGRVIQVAERVEQGTVTVVIEVLEDLPEGSRPGLSIDATIDIRTIEDILFVARPARIRAKAEATIFKLVDSGDAAIRVEAQFGDASINLIEVVSGLEEGDEIILSDMSEYDAVDRVLLR